MMQSNSAAAFCLGVGVGVGMYAIASANASAYPEADVIHNSRLPAFFQAAQQNLTSTPPLIVIDDWAFDANLSSFNDTIPLLSAPFRIEDPLSVVSKIEGSSFSLDHLAELVDD